MPTPPSTTRDPLVVLVDCVVSLAFIIPEAFKIPVISTPVLLVVNLVDPPRSI